MDRDTRMRLRQALRTRYSWVADRQWGPAAVESGECDGCGTEARLVTTCGPAAGQYLGRRCALTLGADAWCTGHADDAHSALRWLTDLPPEADTVARVWWIATGEVALSQSTVDRSLLGLGIGSW